MAIAIDEENVGAKISDFLLKVNKAATGVDPCLFDRFEGLNHVETFLFVVDGPAGFEFVESSVRADAHIEVAVGGRFFKKCYMAAVKHVVASANKYLFHCLSFKYGCKGTDY